MALDSRNERAGAVAYPLPWAIFPNPDNSLASATDRLQMAYLYPLSVTAAAEAYGPNRLRVGRGDRWMRVSR